MTCSDSEWFSISDFGGKWPPTWIFRKCLSGFIDGTPIYVLRPNLVKIGRCEVAERSSGLPHKKNLGSVGLVPAPIIPKMGRSRPTFPERCYLLTCPRTPNLVRIGCVLPDLFRTDWFFGPKSQYNIGFQPTVNWIQHVWWQHHKVSKVIYIAYRHEHASNALPLPVRRHWSPVT